MTDNEQPLLHQPEFTIDELRIETEADGNVTLWYDLSGPAFSTQNSMQNLFSDMAAFLEFLKQEEPAVYALYVSEEIVLKAFASIAWRPPRSIGSPICTVLSRNGLTWWLPKQSGLPGLGSDKKEPQALQMLISTSTQPQHRRWPRIGRGHPRLC
ncbi:MAG: hypothetical protein IPL65_01250 [Lewinellaceae bacterium]|nr:hypothetical protein [Lewinellaceae bacterium]